MARPTWICEHCVFETVGGAEVAHEHHSSNGCWGHWLYEHDGTSFTGRSIHTSDAGGYYLDGHHDPEVVKQQMQSRWKGISDRQIVGTTKGRQMVAALKAADEWNDLNPQTNIPPDAVAAIVDAVRAVPS